MTLSNPALLVSDTPMVRLEYGSTSLSSVRVDNSLVSTCRNTDSPARRVYTLNPRKLTQLYLSRAGSWNEIQYRHSTSEVTTVWHWHLAQSSSLLHFQPKTCKICWEVTKWNLHFTTCKIQVNVVEMLDETSKHITSWLTHFVKKTKPSDTGLTSEYNVVGSLVQGAQQCLQRFQVTKLRLLHG